MKTVEPSDHQLVEEFRKGNEKSFALLMQRYESKIFATVKSKVKQRENAEEIVQDIFVKVALAIKETKYNNREIFSHWLNVVAHNTTSDYFRNQDEMFVAIVNNEDNQEAEILDESPNREEQIVAHDRCHLLKHLVKKLPTKKKQILLLHYFIKLSRKQISEYLGIHINTVDSTVQCSLYLLKEYSVKYGV